MGFLGPILAVAAPIVQGVGGFMAGQSNAKAARAQAKEELRASQDEERQVRLDARRQIGEQLASQYANGMTGGSGTALAALRESQLDAALDAMEVRRQGIGKASAYRRQAKNAERESYFSLASGLLGAATTAMGQKTDWAQARAGTSGGR